MQKVILVVYSFIFTLAKEAHGLCVGVSWISRITDSGNACVFYHVRDVLSTSGYS